MNCRKARSLFSAYLDQELPKTQGREIRGHLELCPSCDGEWESFRLTVRLVSRLPQQRPNPAFVGHVLDRVRAFEDGVLPRTLDDAYDVPMGDRDAESASSGVTLPGATVFHTAWTRVRHWTAANVLPPRTPAFVAMSLVAGVFLGYLVTQSPSDGPINAVASGSSISTTSTTLHGSNPVGPFSDIADDLNLRFPADGSNQDTDPVKVLAPDLWNGTPDLQHQVRSRNDGPKITF